MIILLSKTLNSSNPCYKYFKMNTISLFCLLSLFSLFQIKAQNTQLFPQMPGMVSYTYRNSFAKDVAATLDTLQKLGIKDMEFSNLFGKKASEIRQLLDAREMNCSSFGVGFSDLTSKLSEVAENAKTLGAKYVRVAWIPHKDSFTLENAKIIIEEFKDRKSTRLNSSN